MLLIMETQRDNKIQDYDISFKCYNLHNSYIGYDLLVNGYKWSEGVISDTTNPVDKFNELIMEGLPYFHTIHNWTFLKKFANKYLSITCF